MTSDAGVVRSISWRDLCAWTLLFRAFRLSISLPLLLLALAGALGTTAGWRVVAAVFPIGHAVEGPSAVRVIDVGRGWPGTPPGTADVTAVARHVLPTTPGDLVTQSPSPDSAESLGARLYPRMPFYLFVEPFRQLFRTGLSWNEFFVYLAGGLWTLAVWALFGGAIARITAVRLGRDERVGIRESIAFAGRKWGSLTGAPLMGLLAIAISAIPLWILGLIMRTNVGVLVAGLSGPIVALIGLMMSLFAVGLLFGWPLMWSTIASEGSDAFDAFSRAYAYSFQRPLHYLAYAVLCLVLGCLGWLVVAIFCESVIGLAQWAISWGTGAERLGEIAAAWTNPSKTTSSVLWFGTQLIAFFQAGVRSFLTAYQYSFFWVAATGVYLLLRRDSDQTEIDDIYLGDELAAPYGVPSLPPDEAGVPGVNEAEQASEKPVEDEENLAE